MLDDIISLLKRQNPVLLVIFVAIALFVGLEFWKYYEEKRDEQEAWEAYKEYMKEVSKEQRKIAKEYKEKYGVDLIYGQ
ncbi:tetratricopeptide repeat protein [Campylobacter curvus]|uniref:tetratricopeptide repeat protein n=1 Tax=Campylobacter curvus TaxID=200 RepID=UPI00146FD7FA|nr:tetratricopeptide repeat protein [Campylobacter curvus]